MKATTILILVLFLLNACSSAPMPNKLAASRNGVLFAEENRKTTESDYTFKSHVQRFQKYKRTVDRYYRPRDVVVVFGSEFSEEFLTETTAACIYYEKDQREIRINEKKWDSFGPSQKEFTIYHYMVHCDLDNHEHNSEKTDRNVPVSAMSNYVVDERILKQNRAYYLREIFKNH
jgi:hypothetical protein